LRLFARALTLYWGTYALGFFTSVYFIALGYGSAELNQFQRALIISPGPDTLLPWMANQGVWIGLGVAGLLAIKAYPSLLKGNYLGMALVLLSLFRVYGASTNVGFTLGAVFGLVIAPATLFLLFSAPVMALFLGDLVGYVRKALVGPRRSDKATSFD
jgi:hypothetical protein